MPPAFIETVGGFLFRRRSWTPWPPILLFLLLARPTAASLLTGAVLMCLGEALRIWANAHIGGISRTRGDQPGARLIVSGPFAHMRNPLYIGNLFLTLGAAWMSGRLWLLAVAAALFFAQYIPVVRWEESRMRDAFGGAYEQYCARTPRWFPRFVKPPPDAARVKPSLRRALYVERRTFLAIAAVAALFTLRFALRPLF